MKKIAVVGVYGAGDDFTTGQAVKCYTLINWLNKKYGESNVKVVNTYRWKNNPIKLFINLLIAMYRCENIILMPAQNGLKVFAPLTYYLNKIFRRKIHYIVIGGWLADMIKDKSSLKKYIISFNGVYVETKSMLKDLEKLELKNLHYMPNTRDYIKRVEKKIINKSMPVPICTYSRVVKEKGIEDAIEICKIANDMLNKNAFRLDIFGKVENDYQEELRIMLEENKEIVRYCGVKSANETISVLSKYNILLFPTYYEGEGLAGTVLDAFATGTPIIANDWKYNREIIENTINGYIYNFRDVNQAAKQLLELYNNPNIYNNMSNNCRESSLKYATDVIMGEFSKML